MLNDILKDLNSEYFKGDKKLPTIRFMKKPLVNTFGRYNPTKDIIEINPILLNDLRVLRFIVWHEFCHSILGMPKKRKKKFKWHHSKAFYELEGTYKDYEKEKSRYILFVRDYWLKIGYLKPEELKAIEVKQ